MAERAVRHHVSMIYSKLGVQDRCQIIHLAKRLRYYE
jgi:DNA-binding NarL/FixJ family response regulator